MTEIARTYSPVDLWNCHEASTIALTWSDVQQAWIARCDKYEIKAEAPEPLAAIEALAREVCEYNGWSA